MGYNHPEIVKLNPYYDDFEENKKFLKILFKPGYAVQARELSQLQSILQSQIAKFGSHVFKDGSQVFGGNVTFSGANYIKVLASNLTSTILQNLNSSKGAFLTQGTSTSSTYVRAKIVDVLQPTSGDNYVILVFNYLTGNTFSNNTNITVTKDSTSFTFLYNTNLTGECQTLSIDSGIFYVDGFFVTSEPQIVTLYRTTNGIRYFNDAILTTEGVTNRIGFEIERTVVTSVEDSTLNDPARGFYNYNAPGADRYVINLNLTAEEYDPQSVEPGEFVTADFVEIARVNKGILEYVKKVPSYSDLIDTLARRTYDESGNYTVKPFELEVKNHYRNDVYDLYLAIGSSGLTTTEIKTLLCEGDYLVGITNGSDVKKGKIVSISDYTATDDEANTTADSVPYFVVSVTREPVGSPSSLNYTFFVGNNENVYLQKANYNASGGQLIGKILRVAANRDANGVYAPTENGSKDKFVLSVKPGKAYVYGYEFETINNTNIVLDKERSDSIVSLSGYNLGSNIGNYFVVESPLTNGVYKFNNWNSNINLESMPYFKFGGRYERITMQQSGQDLRSLYCKYWSPVAGDQTTSYHSVLFLTDETGSQQESIAGHSNPSNQDYLDLIDKDGESSNDTAGFVRPQLARESAKYVGGGTSGASGYVTNMSVETEINISRLVFSEPWHGNFETAYDPDTESSDSTGNTTYSGTTYAIKQIECTDTSDPLKIKVTTGNALRWVPASETGESSTSGSTLYTQLLNSYLYDGSSDATPRFNIEHGIIFTDPSTSTSPISYGSSISYIIREARTKKLIVRAASDLNCVTTADCSLEGQGGFYSVGDIVTQTYTKNGLPIQVTAEVIAIGGNFTEPNSNVELYVQSSGIDPVYGSNDPDIETLNIEDVSCLNGPCGLYLPISSVSLDNPSCGELVRIGFKENGNYGSYTVNQEVFQYNYVLLREDEFLQPSVLDGDLIKGKVISWDITKKELVVLETQNRFEKENGSVYEKSTTVKYGGRGWDTYRTKHATESDGPTGISVNDIETVSGIFVDIQGRPTKNFIENSKSVFQQAAVGAAISSEEIKQEVAPGIESYNSDDDYIAGEQLEQLQNPNAKGIVLSWSHRDPTNPADNSPSILVYLPTGTDDFIVGSAANNKPIRGKTSNTSYNVSGQNTTKTKEIIGAGRLRALKKQDSDAYQAYFFDIKMDYLPDLSRKYNLNEVSQFYFEESFANTILSEFEDEDIQLAEGTAIGSYIFQVHPTKGIDVITSTSDISYSKVYDTDKNSLLFPLAGSSSIKNVSNSQYRIQQQFSTTDTNSTEIKFNSPSPTVRFIGGESSVSGKVDSNDLIEHYILIGKLLSDGSSQIIDLTSGYNVYTNNYSSTSDVSTITIKKSSNTSFSNYGSLTLVANLNVNTTGSSQFRSKKLNRIDSETVVLKKTKDGSWKGLLANADILSVDKINTLDSSTDIKNKFEIFDGQTDNIYDVGHITLKSEYTTNGDSNITENTVKVWYRYFVHSGEGPITVNSYVNTTDNNTLTYDEIPHYTSPSSGKTVRLNSVIDMRPVKSISGTTGTILHKWLPAPASSFDVDYEYYLGRAYKLAITRDLKFKVIPGIPAFNPELPRDDENAMTIYDIVASPYIFDKTDITSSMINNRRYTMKDIIDLDQRIQSLEKYTTLNSLEKEAQLKSILDSTGQLERVKSSILVDTFSTYEKADTLNSQFNACIDPESNVLRCPFSMNSVELGTPVLASGLTKTNNNIVMLDYTETPCVSQYLSTGTEIINQFDTVSWIGTVTITPSGDSWFDDTVKPDIRENNSGENDAIINIEPSASNNDSTGINQKFGFWNKHWFGNTIKNKMSVVKSDMSRGFVYETQRTNPAEQHSNCLIKVGENKVVDKSIVPYIRSKTISATVEGMRPYTSVSVFFDDVDITSQCSIANLIGTTVSGGRLKTDKKGSLQFTYTIPENTFKSGNKIITVTSSLNKDDTPDTIAENVYYATGAIDIANEKCISTRKILKTPSVVDNTIDPISQTFVVDEKLYPQGIFVSSVDVFFASKPSDTVNGLPVVLEIRTTNNGYPSFGSDASVYPFATKTLYPTDIIIGENINQSVEDSKTTFTFDTPVHLLPGEHALVLRTNSSEYSVYVAEIGESLINSDMRVGQQPAIGSFFRSQNASKWVALENVDMMFNINRCVFETTNTNNTLVIRDIQNPNNVSVNYEMFVLNNDEIKFNNTDIVYELKTTPKTGTTINSNYNKIIGNNTVELNESNTILYTGNSVEIKTTLSSDDDTVSPIIDLDRLSYIAINNLIENNSNTVKDNTLYNGELEPRTPLEMDSIARVRYISKIVELESGFESTNIKAIINCNIPSGSSIQVFLKYQSSGKDQSFDNERYVQLTCSNPTYVSPNKNSYKDLTFTLPEDLTESFSKYAIKICLYSSSAVNAPKIKEMRVISVI